MNPKGSESQIFKESLDSIKSLRMIYLKKLSTGSDEFEQHQKQLAELKKKIENSQATKKDKEIHLKNIRE